jgi:hypothetical protein
MILINVGQIFFLFFKFWIPIFEQAFENQLGIFF